MNNASRAKLNTTTDIFIKEQVSSCLSLGKETGNFWSYLESSSGNNIIESQAVPQPDKAVSLETCMETNRKPATDIEETFTPPKLNKNFQSIDDFFVYALEQNLALLPDDKRWIKTICFGISQSTLNELLIQYTMQWKSISDSEFIQYKKQNAGRRFANEWLREQLITRHRSRYVNIN